MNRIWTPRPVPRTFADIVMPIGLRGRTKWRVLDGDGKPTLTDVIHEDGHVSRWHEGPWNSNLITNAGLDDWGTEFAYTNGNANCVYTPRTWFRVGTGSTTPAFTDVALDNEVQASNAAGTGSGAGSSNDGVTYTLAANVSRRVTMTADRNLTEYGLSANQTGDLFVRELFRDQASQPVTISLLTGKILEINHDLVIDLPMNSQSGTVDIEEYDATNTLVGTTTYDLELGWMFGEPLGVIHTFNPATSIARENVTIYAMNNAWTLPTTTFGWSSAEDLANYIDFLYDGAMTLSTYTGGSYTRTKTTTLNTTELNETAYGYVIAFAQSGSINDFPRSLGGLGMRFDTGNGNPGTFTKLNTHTLTLGFTVSWNRV